VSLRGGLASGALMVCEPPTGWNRDPRIAELSNKNEVGWRLAGGAGAAVALANPIAIGITKVRGGWGWGANKRRAACNCIHSWRGLTLKKFTWENSRLAIF